jgi:branched-chain amino acid transport system substrate-binding protein
MRLTSRVRVLAATLVAPLVLFAAGCAASPPGAADPAAPVKIGWLSTLSGVYQAPGTDMRDGFQLYLDLHGGKLGGRTIDLIVADEGDGPATARPAAERLVKQQKVTVLAGVLNAASFLAVNELTNQAKIPLVGSNARPTRLKDVTWVWTTSWLNQHAGQAIAPYIKAHVDGPVWAIGPDNQGGYDQVGGFVDKFVSLGGRLANSSGKPTWTPFPNTTNFLPYLTQIAASEAKAVYAFFAGANAIDFVKQYRQSDAKNLPLYGAYLTEGTVLNAQAEAAEGILNVLNYSPDLDNPANRSFVAAWSARHDRTPTVFAADSYDAAAVLDRALASIAGQVTPSAINEAIGKLGQIDSPRGSWQFNATTHTPIQRWYLRKVARDGSKWSNVVVEDLATLS